MRLKIRDKVLLLDAIYVNYGGALKLLHYLVDSLQDNGIRFCLLADSRCEGLFDGVDYVVYLNAGEYMRRKYYSANMNSLSSVFCFGNVPPPIRLKVPVYTYFHNINMLTLYDCRNLKQKLLFWLKRTYITVLKANTDEWITQTDNTANELVRHIGVSPQKVKILPFYPSHCSFQFGQSREDYVFVGEYSGSKGHDELLNAWRTLHMMGIDVTLHLTVSSDDCFKKKLQSVASEGVSVINHGFMPADKVADLYMQSKATIYPSYNESFGLGLVEAMESGCDVIASDRPFVYSICEPSGVFDPKSPESIVQAVVRYESGRSKPTKQIVRNRIDEIIELIK